MQIYIFMLSDSLSVLSWRFKRTYITHLNLSGWISGKVFTYQHRHRGVSRYHDCLFNSLLGLTIKNIKALHYWPFTMGTHGNEDNLPATGVFASQTACDAENFPMFWHCILIAVPSRYVSTFLVVGWTKPPINFICDISNWSETF